METAVGGEGKTTPLGTLYDETTNELKITGKTRMVQHPQISQCATSH